MRAWQAGAAMLCARPCAAATLVLVLAASASAAIKTDVVVMANGDRVTCEVRTLSRGQLQVKTDDMGTLSIEWIKVASVTTTGLFDISVRDGRRFVGRLTTSQPQIIAVVQGDGSVAASLPTVDIVWFGPIKSGFFQKIDGSLDLGTSYTQASGVAQLSFDSTAVYRQPSFSARADFSASLTRQPNEPDTSRYLLSVGYTRYRANRWFINPVGFVEQNTDLGYDLRATAALSIGRSLVQSNRGSVRLAGGLAVGRELPVDGTTVTNVDALVAFDAELFSYDYPKTDITLQLLTFPSLSDPGRVRLNANTKLKRELLKDFFFSITAYDQYDNRPPTPEASVNDVGFSLSVGWSF